MSRLFSSGQALVIGAGADLPVTITDAQAVAALLTDPTRCAYPPGQVRLLAGPAAGRRSVLDALQALTIEVNADPDSTAVIYFSGHGVATPDYYFLPNGYDRSDLPGTAISSAEFTRHVAAIRARRLLVVLDCCRAGGMGDAKDIPSLPFPSSPVPADLSTILRAGSGRVLIASSRRDEQSFTGSPYSVFTNELLKAFAGYGAFERDGYARVLDIAMWVGRRVPERTGDRQHPIIKVSNLEDNFALAYYAAGGALPKALPWVSEPAPTFPTLDRADLLSWRTQLRNYRDNLLLIEERISDYVDFVDVPLQLVKGMRQTQARIADLERRLGIAAATEGL